MGQIAPPDPVIPPRNSVRIKEKRRKSLPASTSALANTQNHFASSVNVQPASTEVISSLISTLSAISSPAEHHFDSVPTITASYSTPISPRAWQTEQYFPLVSKNGRVYERDIPSPARAGFGMDATLSKSEVYERPLIDTDVGKGIQTGQLAPWRQSSKELRNSPSRSQLDSGNLDEDTFSIGNVTIEQRPRKPSTSVASTSAGKWKGMRSYQDLKFDLYSHRIREGKGHLWIRDGDTEIGIRNSAIKQRLSDSSTLSSGSAGPSDQPSPIRIPKRSSSARHSIATMDIDARSLDSGASPTAVGSGRLIPTRASSMRHSLSGSPAQRQLKSYRSKQNSPEGDKRLSIDSLPEFPERELAQVMHDLVEEDEVTRRIKELKDQKRIRDHELKLASPDLRSCSRSPRLSPQAKVQSLALSQNGSAPGTPSPLDTAEVNEPIARSSAPSPAIAQRIDRNHGSKTNAMALKTTVPSTSRQNVDLSKAQSSPPRRSSSRLLRRLSRPISPATEEKHRRAFSGGLSQPHTPVEERQKSWDLIDESIHEYLGAPRLSQSVKEPLTGRIISFSEVGDPVGSAVFCYVGMGLTRYITAFYDELATTLKLRLITPDRPGVGASDAHTDGMDTPLGWPDDVRAICQKLDITKFSILAHSAGAIYALATALRMPQHIRGRIHLLAPWIPPSQLSAIGSQQETQPGTALPYSQRFLRSLPATFLKAANSSWLSATSASVTSKSPRRSKRRGQDPEMLDSPKGNRGRSPSPFVALEKGETRISSPRSKDQENVVPGISELRPALPNRTSSRLTEKERRSNYDSRLTEAIWDRSTTGANPAVDLLVCLERRRSIGFRYVDIKKAIVIHHGSKDTRVPVENVKWLGKTMRRCEVRVLDGEGHGLMASAAVMGNILMEISREWDDWIRVTRGRGVPERRVTAGI